MDIGIHGVKRVMIDKVHQIGTSKTYTCNLHVVTASARVDIILYADDAAKMEIVKVKDSSDFYKPEPAS